MKREAREFAKEQKKKEQEFKMNFGEDQEEI